MDIGDIDDVTRDLAVLLASDGRDFLIRNNGDQVKLNSFIGEKIVGIYSCSLDRDCSEHLTPILVNLYQEIALSKGQDFEVVMVSFFEDEDSFNAAFAQMPWLAVPHSDSKAVRIQLSGVCWKYVDLVIIDKSGKISIHSACNIIRYYGAEAYPFTRDRITFLNKQDAEAKRNQSITTLLGDYLIRGGTTEQIPVSQLAGKTIGLCFDPYSDDVFMDMLVEVYNEIKSKGGEFEIVQIPKGYGQAQEFNERIESMPWLALPFRDARSLKLWYYFPRIPQLGNVGSPPFLFIIGPDGKTLSFKGSRFVRELGADAFPFTPQKIDEIEQRKLEPWSLEKLLVFRGHDFVIRKDGSTVPVADLNRKTILFYFSNQDLVSSLDKVLMSCREIKDRNKDEFEVIFVGFDHIDESNIDEYMLKVPRYNGLEDRLKYYWFTVPCLPTAIIVDPSCQVVDIGDVVDIISVHGAEAYPFTEEHVIELDDRAARIAKEWPKKLSHDIHEHELDRILCHEYDCDGCYWNRNRWNFVCNECRGFNLHHDYDFGGCNGIGKPDGRHVMEDFVGKK